MPAAGWIRNLHLRTKLILLSAITVGLALVLACAGFLLNDLRLLRDSKLRQLKMQAELLKLSSSVVVSMGQRHQAEELLASLRSQPTIEMAGLYDANDRRVASYAPDISVVVPSKVPMREGVRTTASGYLEVFQPIMDPQQTRVGTVYLRTSMRDLWEQMSSYSRVSLLVMVLALGVATLFGSVMQNTVSKPILELAAAAQKITSNDDYSIRVHSDSRDELGILYNSFNRMIEQVQSSRNELELGQKQLERRIADRTFLLQEEIEHRTRIQSELVNAKERAEAASQAKSSFLANMSHEIRTPLNAILGFADLLRVGGDRNNEAERQDFLETIHRSGEHLLTLVNDILDLTKIEAGQMDYEQAQFSPHQVIAEVMSVMRARAHGKGLALDYHWYGSIPEFITSDSARFRQLLLNLIGNAIKFTERGGVQAVARLDAERGELTVDVIDTGIGIPAGVCESIFKPFTQADSSVTRRFGGTGLGLSISRHLATGLGGRISVQSEVGKGSMFSVTIATGPLSEVRLLDHPVSDIMTVARPQPTPPRNRLDGLSVLVVDDGETNRKLIRLVLDRAGATTRMAENGLEAVELGLAYHFDLILMDMQMPLMDGYTAAGRLREHGCRVPIVALTAHAMRGDAERCIEAGCSDYLTKPINPEKLIEKISTILGEINPVPATAPKAETKRLLHDAVVSELPVDDQEFADIVTEFVDRFRLKLTEMHQAHASEDWQTMAELAHWLAGAGGSAGFPILTDSARELETKLLRNDLSELDDLLDRLDHLLLLIAFGAPLTPVELESSL
jgi:signal transduction histidine kinase/DNA-binding response OmpR family regulator